MDNFTINGYIYFCSNLKFKIKAKIFDSLRNIKFYILS